MIKQLTEWVTVEVVKKAVTHVLLMFVPGAGIVRAIIGIYDTVMFFIRRAAEIARMVGNFLSSIDEIAAGNIAAAAAALEQGLARALKLVIDFLARLLKLDGIPGKVRGVIEKLAGKVEAVVDRVVGFLLGKGRQQVARDPSPTSAVRAPVLTALQRELSDDHSFEQATAIVRRIGEQTRLQGVRRLAVGARNPDGTWDILLETNPTASVAQIRLSGAVPKGRSVKAHIELLLRPPPKGAVAPTGAPLLARLGTAGEPPQQTTGKQGQSFRQIAAVREEAATRSRTGVAIGGVVVMPDDTRIHLVTWNTSSVALRASGNDSHAESQFDQWVKTVSNTEFGQGLLGRVQRVEMHLRDYSPCGMCIDMLRGTVKHFSNLEAAHLYWYEFYPGWTSPTTWAGLRSLSAARWQLHAPGTAMPPEEDATKARVHLVNRPR
jgi:hypothetical protein